MSPQHLSPLADPVSLARIRILILPVHGCGNNDPGQPPPLTGPIYEFWSQTLRRHQTLRGDEIVLADYDSKNHHQHGSGAVDDPRSRFLPIKSGGSTGVANPNHYHLAFQSQPPAKHLYPLSLLRMSAFPLAVIGFCVGDESDNFEMLEESFRQSLATSFPLSSPFPIVTRLVVVPPTLPQDNLKTPVKSGLSGMPIPSTRLGRTGSGVIRLAPVEAIDSWVTVLLGEVVGQLSQELGVLASELESPNGLKTLSGTLLPSLSSQTTGTDNVSTPSAPGGAGSETRTARLPPTGQTSSHKTDIVYKGDLNLSRTLTPGGRPLSVRAPSAPPVQIVPVAVTPSPVSISSNPFRRSTAISSPFSRTPSAGSISSSSSSALPAKDPINLSRYTLAPIIGVAGGRLLKLLGDMYLLTGMYADARRCYNEAAERARSLSDPLWEASAREGQSAASILEAWEGRDGSNTATPFPSSNLASEIFSSYLLALSCLSRSSTPFPSNVLAPVPQSAVGLMSTEQHSTTHQTRVGTGEGLLAYLYTSLCIRTSYFALVLFASGGWGSIALSSIVAQTLPRSFPHFETRDRMQTLNLLAIKSQISRHSILGHAERAIGPYSRAMTKAEQLAAYVDVLWVSKSLAMERKEAYIIYRIFRLLSSLINEGREENNRLYSKSRSLSHSKHFAEAIHNTDEAIGLGLGMTVTAAQPMAIRQKESTEGNSVVIGLFNRICDVLGISLLRLGSQDSVEFQKRVDLEGNRFGWAELQVEVMKAGIAMAEVLPDHISVYRYCLSALHALYPSLNTIDQNYLAKMYPQARSVEQRRAIDFVGVSWWIPGQVILSMEISALTPNKKPFRHFQSDIVSTGSRGTTDPFLYNPRLKAFETGNTELVANEQVDIFVTIQNIFGFDLEIQDLSLLTSGVTFVTNPMPIILPQSSVQTVRLTGFAPSSGSLLVRGVNVSLADGSSTEFLLPNDDSAKDGDDMKRKNALVDVGKSKSHGLDSRRSLFSTPENNDQIESRRWLKCEVIDEQPLLWIKNSSLTHGTVMLYDGETSEIRITLENSSGLPVDFIQLYFDDSLSREADALLSDGHLSPEQAFGLSDEFQRRPVFTWDPTSDVFIPPGGRITLVVQCLGKVGCIDGTIRIDYGLLHRSSPNLSVGGFYTRQIVFPIMFTVYHTLECQSFDLIPLRPSTNSSQLSCHISPTSIEKIALRSSAFPTSPDGSIQKALSGKYDSHILLSISVRNVYNLPFEVALSCKCEGQDPNENLVITRLVSPGATERIVLPIPRLTMTMADSLRPIPLFLGRQYVVGKEERSVVENSRLRELFWYRERLFQSVEMSWHEPRSLRFGTISLRNQSFTTDHLIAIRSDELQVTMSIGPDDVEPAAMNFVSLCVKVVNNLQRTVRPLIRLETQPLSSTRSAWTSAAPSMRTMQSDVVPKNIVFDGMLAVCLSTLAPGESTSHTFHAAVLASGWFIFRAAVEEISLRTAETLSDPPQIFFSNPLSVSFLPHDISQ